MTGIWRFLIALGLSSSLQAASISDGHVKNLALVGVIHVQGPKAVGRSVAVLRERSTGKTRILHKGDRVPDGDLEVRELGPRHITLGRGSQTFVLRVENFSESPGTLSQEVETTEVELEERDSIAEVEQSLLPEPQAEPAKPEAQGEQRRLIPDPDCIGDDCSSATE